jgi:hypothetical protein
LELKIDFVSVDVFALVQATGIFLKNRRDDRSMVYRSAFFGKRYQDIRIGDSDSFASLPDPAAFFAVAEGAAHRIMGRTGIVGQFLAAEPEVN